MLFQWMQSVVFTMAMIFRIYLFPTKTAGLHSELEIAAQGIAQCEVSATHVVVDAALRHIGKSRHCGHKIANISVIVNGFENGFHQWIQRIFWS